MATKKKGILTSAQEWARHLRKYGKRRFWHQERTEEKNEIDKQIEDSLKDVDLTDEND